MIRLATLDIAGTTVDEDGHVYRVLEESVRREGADITPEQLQEWMGVEKREAITHLLDLGGVDADDARIDGAFAWFLDELARTYRQTPPRALPGVEDAIATLRSRGVKVVLTTGFTRGITDPLLAGLGWTVGDGDPAATLDGVVCADEVRAGRPAPYMIHHAMELVGVPDVREVSASGDTMADAKAARAAGVLAISVCTGKLDRADFEGVDVDHVVEGVADMPGLPEFAGDAA